MAPLTHIPYLSVFEDLMVQEVVRQPTALLPEQSQQQRSKQMHPLVAVVEHQPSRERHKRQVGSDLVCVEQLAT